MAIARLAPPVFFDTNVLLYLLSSDTSKADSTEHLVNLGGTISVQVLNEFTQVARRKFQMPATDVIAVLATLRRALKVEANTEATHDLGVVLSMKYSLSIYDAMIAASGLLCGAKTLYSEDMQSGLLIEKQLRIENPFGQGFKLP